jgi:hypothetical protein
MYSFQYSFGRKNPGRVQKLLPNFILPMTRKTSKFTILTAFLLLGWCFWGTFFIFRSIFAFYKCDFLSSPHKITLEESFSKKFRKWVGNLNFTEKRTGFLLSYHVKLSFGECVMFLIFRCIFELIPFDQQQHILWRVNVSSWTKTLKIIWIRAPKNRPEDITRFRLGSACLLEFRIATMAKLESEHKSYINQARHRKRQLDAYSKSLFILSFTHQH